MWEKIKQFFRDHNWAWAALAFILGAVAGVLLLPSRHEEETLKTHYEEQIKSIREEHSKAVKDITEKYAAEIAQSKQTISSYESKISSLQTQVSELKSKTKTAYYKVIRPDGTIEIKKFSESEVNESTKVITQIQQEFIRKISEIETKWETIHKEKITKIQEEFQAKEREWKQKIQDLEQSKVVDINAKKFGIELGITNSLNYYGHATGDIVGPIFMGLHGQAGNAPQLGLGLGLRF